MTFQDLFMCVFQDFMSIFHVFPGLFNRVDIEKKSGRGYEDENLAKSCSGQSLKIET